MTYKTRLLAGVAALACATPALAQDIEVQDAYARAASPAAKSGAAFMVIHNRGDADDHLIGVSSPVAQKVQLHTHQQSDAGVMRMIHVEDGFALPVDGTLRMQRGGHHVMFMGLTRSFTQGAMVPLTLIFESSGKVSLEVPVDLERKPGRKHSQ